MTDNYWWEQRLADANFSQGRGDAAAGAAAAKPNNFHYMAGYNTVKLLEQS